MHFYKIFLREKKIKLKFQVLETNQEERLNSCWNEPKKKKMEENLGKFKMEGKRRKK